MRRIGGTDKWLCIAIHIANVASHIAVANMTAVHCEDYKEQRFFTVH